jgi:predicted nicotinamide N-methyase
MQGRPDIVALIREGAAASRKASLDAAATAPAPPDAAAGGSSGGDGGGGDGRRGGAGLGSSTLLERMVSSLAWRDLHARADIYPIECGGATLAVRQVMMGEVRGLGTGGTVWPAALVLAKHLERRFGAGGLRGKRVIELGAGTGATGIAAAALGATVVLTDQASIIDLTRQNAAGCGAAVEARGGRLHVALLDWADAPAAERLRQLAGGAFDLILVSECVLPKLYPIEPLVAAIDMVDQLGCAAAAGSKGALVMVAYEHRAYEHFHPPARFEELCAAKGYALRVVPVAEQDPLFTLPDDVFLWELQREAAVVPAVD